MSQEQEGVDKPAYDISQLFIICKTSIFSLPQQLYRPTSFTIFT